MNRIIRKWLLWILVLLLLVTAMPQQTQAAIKIDRSSVTVYVNQTVTLKVSGTKAKVTWASSNKKIATVSSNGLVKGVKKGTATIRAKVSNTTLKCEVTVKNPPAAKKESKVPKERYANFRSVRAGTIAPNVLYRCINPIIPKTSKQYMSAYYADRLLQAHHVNTVINLCDTMAEIKRKGCSQSTYYKKLVKEGKVFSRFIYDNGNYVSAARKREIAGVVRVIIRNKGPYAIHCRWGQGRTGMVIMLLECLMGADYNYIYYDFVTSPKNLSLVGKKSSSSDYNREFSKYMKSITGKSASNSRKPRARDWKKVNLAACAGNYLKAGGMTDAEIRLLKSRLSHR